MNEYYNINYKLSKNKKKNIYIPMYCFGLSHLDISDPSVLPSRSLSRSFSDWLSKFQNVLPLSDVKHNRYLGLAFIGPHHFDCNSWIVTLSGFSSNSYLKYIFL